MKYCNFCGLELESNSQCSCAAAQKHVAKKKVIGTLSIFVGVIAILTLVILGMLNGDKDDHFHSLSKTDPFDYTEVKFEGINSMGEVIINYNSDALIEDIIGEIPDTYEEDVLAAYMSQYFLYHTGIEYSYDYETDLSNGDIITVTFSVSDEASSKVKGGSKQYTVSGLSEMEFVDVFSLIDIEYEGVAGNAHAKIIYPEDSEMINSCYFGISPNYNLSTGDEITVTLSWFSESTLHEKYNVVPKETARTYIVPALSEYITSAEQIPNELLKEFSERFLNQVKEDNVNDSSFSYGEAKLYGIYFVTKKTGVMAFRTNILKIVVYYEQYYQGDYWRTVYEPLEFYNVTVSPEGELQLEYEDGHDDTFTTDIDVHMSEYKEDYDIAEVVIP